MATVRDKAGDVGSTALPRAGSAAGLPSTVGLLTRGATEGLTVMLLVRAAAGLAGLAAVAGDEADAAACGAAATRPGTAAHMNTGTSTAMAARAACRGELTKHIALYHALNPAAPCGIGHMRW